MIVIKTIQLIFVSSYDSLTKQYSSYSLAVMIANKTSQLILVSCYESQPSNTAHTHKEFILEVRRWKSRWDIYPTDQINPSNLCETLGLVSYNLYPNIYCILTATAEKSFSLFETCKDISTLHNGTGKTISLGIATLIYTDTFSLHRTQSQTSLIKTQINAFGL